MEGPQPTLKASYLINPAFLLFLEGSISAELDEHKGGCRTETGAQHKRMLRVFESHWRCSVSPSHCAGTFAHQDQKQNISLHFWLIKLGGFVPNPMHRHPIRAAERAVMAVPWLKLLAPNVAQACGIYYPLCGSCLFFPMEIQVYSKAVGWNLHAFIITNSGWECRSKWCRTFF